MRKVTFDYGAIEQRVLALEGAPKKQLRNILFGMQYGMGSESRREFHRLANTLYPRLSKMAHS